MLYRTGYYKRNIYTHASNPDTLKKREKKGERQERKERTRGKKKKDKKIIRSNIEGNECPEKYYEQRAREDQRGEDKNKQKTFEPEAR